MLVNGIRNNDIVANNDTFPLVLAVRSRYPSEDGMYRGFIEEAGDLFDGFE